MYGTARSSIPMMNLAVASPTITYGSHLSLSNQLLGTMNISGGLCVGLGNASVTPTQGDLHVEGDIRSPALTGAIMYFATSNAPTGWMKCNGAAVSRTTYAKLFSVIGTIHGAGDGSTTFTLPDLRGEFLRAWDDSRGVDSGRSFASAQTHAMEQHYHGTGSSVTYSGGGAAAMTSSGTQLRTGAFDRYSGNIVSATADALETRPRNIALLACIKY